MYFASPVALMDYVTEIKRPYWRMYLGQYCVGQAYRTEESPDVEKNLAQLDTLLTTISENKGTQPAKYRLELHDRVGGRSEPLVVFFTPNNSAIPVASSIGSLSVRESDVQKQIDAALNTYKLQQEVEGLRQQLEARTSGIGFIDKLMPLLEHPAIGHVIAALAQRLLGAPMDMATPDQQHHTDSDDPHTHLETIQQHTGIDASKALERIAQISKENPSIIRSFINNI